MDDTRASSASTRSIPKGPSAIPERRESASHAPPPGAETEYGAQSRLERLKNSPKVDLAFMVLVFFASIGTILVWFEISFLKQNPSNDKFVNVGLNDLGQSAFTLTLAIAALGMSVCSNFFIPPTHAGSLKRFALFLILGYVDYFLCMTRYLYKYWSTTHTSQDYADQLNTIRTGCALVLVCLFPAFLIAFLLPGTSGGELNAENAKKGLKSIRGVIHVITAVLMLLGSIVQWAIKEPCDFANPAFADEYIYLRIGSGVLLAVLLVTTQIMADRATQDVLLWFMASGIVSTFPNTHTNNIDMFNQKSNFHALALAENWLFFLATLVYLMGMLICRGLVWNEQRQIDVGNMDKETISNRIKKAPVILSIALTIFTIISAAMMWSWGDKDLPTTSHQTRQANWVAAMGLYLVKKNLLGQIFGPDFSYLNTTSLMMSFQVVPCLAAFLVTPMQNLNQTSYFRAGSLLMLIAICLSQFITLANIPKKRIDEFLANPSSDDAPARRGPSTTVVFFIWSLAACYSWQDTTIFFWSIYDVAQVIFPSIILVGTLDLFGSSNPEVSRVLYFQSCAMITNPALWPLASFAKPTFGKVFILMGSGLTVGLYSWFNPTDYLGGFHAEAEYPDDEKTQKLPQTSNETSNLLAQHNSQARYEA